jgi:hypothetical protein
MSDCKFDCPIPEPLARFRAYVVNFDFEYIPDSGAPNAKQIMQFRFEDQNPFLARTKALSKIRKIKWALDQVIDDPSEKFQYQGLSLWLEYQIGNACNSTAPEIRKLFLLDGEICTCEDLIQRFSAEEWLLDMMDYSFVCVDPESGGELEYAELVDSMFDGLTEIS